MTDRDDDATPQEAAKEPREGSETSPGGESAHDPGPEPQETAPWEKNGPPLETK